MKKFENKSFTDFVKAMDETGKIVQHEINGCFNDLLLEALDHVGESGLKPSEMRKRINIIEKIKSIPENATVIHLEEEEFRTLHESWNNISWGKVSKAIVDLDDYLKSLADA